MADAPTLGLDVGGAHLKLAQVAGNGRVVARQLPCPLWQGLGRLHDALAQALADLPPAGKVAVTMTGELADLFPGRAAGVQEIVAVLAAAMPRADLRLWAGRRGFVPAEAAADHAAAIASANWLATAVLAARHVGDGLLVDLGSTTTDILMLAGGKVAAEGADDRTRLASGELVYTGLTRSFVMAVARRVPFRGRWMPLMNEYFASMADVYRVLGLLPEAADQHPAADNGVKTVHGSARRLARMVGADLDDAGMEDWRRLAAWLAACQMRQIEDAVRLQLSRGLIRDDAPLIGAGCGCFLLPELARRFDRPCRDFAGLIGVAPEAAPSVATCAPAVAVALLCADARQI